jgi:hypothetical protein
MDTALLEQPTKTRKTLQTGPKGIPDSQIIELVNKDLTDEKIAIILKCDRANITRRRNSLGITRQSLKAYKENRADLLAVHQARFLNKITDNDIRNAPLQSKIWAFGVLYDKERLERGQSTSNVSVLTAIIQSGCQDIDAKQIDDIQDIVVDKHKVKSDD